MGGQTAPTYYAPPPIPLGAREHNGFYLRLGLGGSRFGTSFASNYNRELRGAVEGSFDQGGVAFEVAIGGTPAPGLVIGGALYVDGAIGQPASTDLKVEGVRGGSLTFDRASLALFGPFVDYYIDPKLGLHLQGSLGLAWMAFGTAGYSPAGPPVSSRSVTTEAKSSGGLGFMLGGGYEWWIADQWSLGALLRFVYVSTESNDNEPQRWRAKGFAVPEILFGATYH